jgi:hypothetical protein
MKVTAGDVSGFTEWRFIVRLRVEVPPMPNRDVILRRDGTRRHQGMQCSALDRFSPPKHGRLLANYSTRVTVR